MATGIPYVHETLNLTGGCTPVSAGCDHCWAKRLHEQKRKMKWKGRPKQYDKPFSEVQLFPERLKIPVKRRKPTRFMVCSMGDLFHEDVPEHFIARSWAMMREENRHTFLVFTSRVGRASNLLPVLTDFDRSCPPPNIQLIASVEDQATANARIPPLLECPVAIRGVSYEPALGPVDFSDWLRRPGWSVCESMECGGCEEGDEPCDDYKELESRAAIDWIIFGGESGPDPRPCEDDWARDAYWQCKHDWQDGTAFYMKQLGSWYGRDHAKFETFPKDLQVREFPKGHDK